MILNLKDEGVKEKTPGGISKIIQSELYTEKENELMFAHLEETAVWHEVKYITSNSLNI